MRYSRRLAALVFFFTVCAFAKDKKKVLLPVDVLKARNVLVMVDPGAGIDAADPGANRTARSDVENALIKWGRLMPVNDAFTADLIIVVRKGNGKIVQPTIGGTTANGTPPATIGSTTTPDQSTTHGAVRWGRSGISGDPSNSTTPQSSPEPQIEAGQTQDMFVVYRSELKDDPHWSPLDTPAVWRYIAKNALESPDVPAVEAFRKAIADSEKQLASNP